MGAEPASIPATIGYNRDIRPLFSNTCFKCHGPDVKNNQSDVRLDLSDQAVSPHRDKTGRVSTPIVPGQLSASEVWRRITTTDPTIAMPPRDSPFQLSARDKTLIQRWIEQGAKYEPHWAYILPKKVDPPAVPAGLDAARVHNPVDRFVFGALAAQGLQPSPESDRRTLIRRLSLDLVGLPPTPAETEAFVADTDPGAYDHLVDRLLASPHYGERMAVPWLDLARFADSVGYHGDQLENNFPYREYVIDSFNRNERFDQFTAEQLAGDLLPGATDRQRVATGFNRLNMMTREGGAQDKEYLSKYAADRVRTVSTVWLGSTMACCECHDHKFDPFKTRDFYSLEAYFADMKQWGVYRDYDSSPEKELEGYSDDFPFPPEIEVKSPYLVARQAQFQARLNALFASASHNLTAAPTSLAAVKTWAGAVAPRLQSDPSGWTVAQIVHVETDKDRKAAVQADQSLLITDFQMDLKKLQAATEGFDRALRKQTRRFGLTLHAAPGPMAALRIEVLPDSAHGNRVVVENWESFTISKVTVELQKAGAAKREPLELAAAYADRETDSYFDGEVLMSLLDGWTSRRKFVREPQTAAYLLARPVDLAEGDQLFVTFMGNNVGCVRFAASPLGCRLPNERVSAEELAAFAAAEPTPVQQQLLAAEYFRGTGRGLPTPTAYADALSDLETIADCRNGSAFSVITTATDPRPVRVLPRGDWQNESGELVEPAAPGFLLATAVLNNAPGGRVPPRTLSALGTTRATSRQTRLDLARWLTSRDNPLTARTEVNRLWMQYFGAGLVGTVDDLGTRGDYPTNPELLDWLAVDFMDHGWDIKAMVRLMVTSGTYRQSSRYRPELAEVDPSNRLLARQNPRRLDAEFVRDNALFAAGLLNLEIGGPSVYPYQPAGYYAAIMFPTRDYYPDTDSRQYRRGLYIHWQRTFLHPMLANFDAPSREECTAYRNISSTPQQALTLLNDPTYVEAARGLAEQALESGSGANFGARLDVAYRRLLSRPPRPPEVEALTKFYTEQLRYYRAHPADAEKFTTVGMLPAPLGTDRVELAAWAAVTRVLINLNEAIVRY